MRRLFTNQTVKEKGKKVKVAGWVNTRRDHGKIIFIDIRDKEGVAQVVFTPQNSQVYELAQSLRTEWVIEVEGIVKERPQGTKNPNLPTGDIEIEAEQLAIFSRAKTLPFAIDTSGHEINEEKRLTYRYLDLRRERLKRNFVMRYRVMHSMREFLMKEGFVEIETPILTKSTPEGARDFVVPSRLYAGKFYALPQSPQQYKQLLQVAGFERYFQIARCFRDEDPRTDRQPEFTQLDIEMSFIEREDILELMERLYLQIVHTFFPEKHIQEVPFPRMSYKQAMEMYRSDKPDLRKHSSDPNELAFAFILDFPMFEWKENENRWDAVHHPFTKVQPSHASALPVGQNEEDEKIFIEYIKQNPQGLLAHQYDLALNGYEIGGGSIREHNPRILEAVFEIMGHTKAEIAEQFGHLLEAFEYGVPPHGGIAPGIDRFLAIVLNEPSIREVIAFPKTGDNRDLMMQTPSEISSAQLKELHVVVEKESFQKKQ